MWWNCGMIVIGRLIVSTSIGSFCVLVLESCMLVYDCLNEHSIRKLI